MKKEDRLKALKEYTERTRRILELSSPRLEEVGSAEDYRVHLQHSFQEIGVLGRENNETLEKHLFPLVESTPELTDEEVEVLHEFSAMLIDTTSMENLDLPLIFLQAERILEKAENGGDLRTRILAEDGMVIGAYMMLNLSIRLYPPVEHCFHYRDIGLRAARHILDQLSPEKFAALPDDECRELVLINSRYIRCLFEWDDKKNRSSNNKMDLRLMRRALDLAEDPFYRDLMPDYRWDAHVLRTLQYVSDFSEMNNKHLFTPEELEEIYQCTLRLNDFVEANPELQEACPKLERECYLIRNSYLSGRISLEEYRKELLHIFARRSFKDFSARGMFVRFTTAIEYLLTLDQHTVDEEQAESVRTIQKDLAAYMYQMPKTGVLSFMLTFMTIYLRHYIEVPGGISFQDACLQIMAAMHPPTYVHTLNVATITTYLAEKLIDRDRSLFVGIAGTTNEADVVGKKAEILEFIHNGALLHDIGKLLIQETIMTYGRNLIDSEWELIKAHTLVGAELLQRFPDTAEYAEMALGHHRWFNDSMGYPEEFRTEDSKYRTAIALLEAADCMDAATDSIGRSYKQGKTLDEYIDELREGSGTRYAPYVVELCEDPTVREELQKLLTEGRDENYRKTYHLLKNTIEQAQRGEQH